MVVKEETQVNTTDGYINCLQTSPSDRVKPAMTYLTPKIFSSWILGCVCVCVYNVDTPKGSENPTMLLLVEGQMGMKVVDMWLCVVCKMTVESKLDSKTTTSYQEGGCHHPSELQNQFFFSLHHSGLDGVVV